MSCSGWEKVLDIRSRSIEIRWPSCSARAVPPSQIEIGLGQRRREQPEDLRQNRLGRIPSQAQTRHTGSLFRALCTQDVVVGSGTPDAQAQNLSSRAGNTRRPRFSRNARRSARSKDSRSQRMASQPPRSMTLSTRTRSNRLTISGSSRSYSHRSSRTKGGINIKSLYQRDLWRRGQVRKATVVVLPSPRRQTIIPRSSAICGK